MLGNRRFLIIVISVLSAVALICLGASASEFSREEIDVFDLSSGSLRAGPSGYSVAPSPALFSSTSYYQVDLISSSTDPLWSGSFPTTDVSVYSFALGGRYLSFYFPADGSLHTVRANGNYLFFDGRNVGSVGHLYSCSFSMPDTSFDLGSLWSREMKSVSGLLPSLMSSAFDTILSVGSRIVTFVTSSWVVLVPVVAFVCILGFGVIRRLVRGV